MLRTASNTLPCEFTKARYSRVDKVNSPKHSKHTDTTVRENRSVGHDYENILGVITPESDLYDFMPPTRILSEYEEKEDEEIEQGFYRPKDLDVQVIPCEPLKLPQHLKVFVHDRGEVELFPPIKNDPSRKLCKNRYFCMECVAQMVQSAKSNLITH